MSGNSWKVNPTKPQPPKNKNKKRKGGDEDIQRREQELVEYNYKGVEDSKLKVPKHTEMANIADASVLVMPTKVVPWETETLQWQQTEMIHLKITLKD